MAKKKIQMTEGPLLVNILRFGVPVMLAAMLQLLFNAVDVVVVGRYAGKASLAAVSSTGSLVNLVVNMFMGLSVGTNVIVAKHLGSRDSEGAKKAISTSIKVALISGVILTIVGYFGARTFLALMSTPSDVIELSSTYLRIYFLGMLGLMVYNFGSAILRASGDTKRPLYFLTISGVINALLNLLLVLVFKMDVAGVGIATAVSQWISGGLVLLALVKEHGVIHVQLDKLAIDKQQLVLIAKVGIPAGIQGSFFSLSNVVIQSTVNSFGSAVMAGSGSASSIEGFVYQTMNAFYQTCVTFTSQNIGAKKYERVNKVLFTCMACAVFIGGVTGFGAYLFGPSLLAIYNNDPEVIAAGMIRLNYVCKVYFLCGIMDVFVGSLRGMGNSTAPMLCSILGVVVFRILYIKFIFPMYGTIDIVYLSYPISWIATSLAHCTMFIFTRKNLEKKVALSQI